MIYALSMPSYFTKKPWFPKSTLLYAKDVGLVLLAVQQELLLVQVSAMIRSFLRSMACSFCGFQNKRMPNTIRRIIYA